MPPQHGTPISLTEQERVVVKESLRYVLSDGEIPSEFTDEDIETTLTTHLESVLAGDPIQVQPGMDELYRSVFQSYAQAVAEVLDDDAESAESNMKFFENAFKGVVERISNQTTAF